MATKKVLTAGIIVFGILIVVCIGYFVLNADKETTQITENITVNEPIEPTQVNQKAIVNESVKPTRTTKEITVNDSIEFHTDKKVYKQGENITFVLDSDSKYFNFYHDIKVYKNENKKLRYIERSGINVETCVDNKIFAPRDVMGVDITERNPTSHITFVWDQKYYAKTNVYVMCGKENYMLKELRQTEPGNYTAVFSATLYDADECTYDLMYNMTLNEDFKSYSLKSYSCVEKTFETEFEII